MGMSAIGVGSLRRLGGAALLAAALIACGGTTVPSASDGGGSISQIDACALLTSAEIQAALGKPIGAGVKEDPSGNSTGCDWEGANETDGVAITLTIDEFDQEFWTTVKGTEGVEPMSGIGEEAVRGWVTTSLLMVKHESMEIDLAVVSVFLEDPAIKAALETLGKLVVSRL